MQFSESSGIETFLLSTCYWISISYVLECARKRAVFNAVAQLVAQKKEVI